MALNWYWKDKIGYIEPVEENEHGVVLNLYEGNAMMIGIYEKPSTNEYYLGFFFNDIEHLKRCCNESDFFDNWKCIHVDIEKSRDKSKIKRALIKLSDYVDVSIHRNRIDDDTSNS